MIQDNESLMSATWRGRELKTYDDGWGCLWVYGHEFGPTLLIRSNCFQEAYEIAIDESPTIDRDDLVGAYGFYLMQACRWNEQNSDAPWYVLSDHKEHGEIVSAETLMCEGDRRSIGKFETRDDAIEACLEYVGENEIDLVEGYQHQSNSSGTGIVNVGHYEWLKELTPELAEQDEIEVEVEVDE